MNKTLPSIRIEEKTYEQLHSALKKVNKNPFTIKELSLQELRRFCYEVTTQLILSDKLQDVKIKK